MRSKTGSDREAAKILVAEDSLTQAEQLAYLLEQTGYKVTVARNGKEALAATQKSRPDVIISDIVMPEMDGYALCRQIKVKKALKDIPVILLTSLSGAQDVIKGLECGADSFIRKPYDEKYLLSRLEYTLINRELRKGARVQAGLEVFLDGQRHFITSERQQILDLLVSIYEEAVQMNGELAQKQQDLSRSYQSLNGLYRIAESLNGSTSEKDVAEKALDSALELPGVQTGWLLLRADELRFRVAAARNLPPGLTESDLTEGDCVCHRKLLGGEYSHSAEILECERLQALNGMANGLRYHATIPLWAGPKTLGVMDLVSGDAGMFSQEDLKILHGVGNQIGVALERAQLYADLEKKVQERTAALRKEVAERKRAQEEVQRNLDRIHALHEVDLAIGSTLDLHAVLTILLEKLDRFFPYPLASTVRLINKQTGLVESAACRNIEEEESRIGQPRPIVGRTGEIIKSRAPLTVRNVLKDPRSQNPDFYIRNNLVSYAGVPLIAKDEVLGVLVIHTRSEHDFSSEEVDFLTTLAGQAAIAINNAQLHEETIKQSVELKKAITVKDEFLSVMSHELRTPLNVVVGYTGMIMDGMLGEVNEKQKEAMDKVIRRTNDQLALVNNVLFATVLESENVVVDMQDFNLEDLLNQLKLDYEAPINKELSLDWDYPFGLPIISTDSAKLKHILRNLIDNGLKFTAKGSVTISAQIRQQARGNRQQEETSLTPHDSRLTPRYVEFKVSDTGAGIQKEHLPFIFDKFRQVDSSETRLYGGVGMGLYIVKKFTELLGGTVEVESEPGKGSTFTVTLPVNS